MARKLTISRNPLPGTSGRRRTSGRPPPLTSQLLERPRPHRDATVMNVLKTPAEIFLRALARVLADADMQAAQDYDRHD